MIELVYMSQAQYMFSEAELSDLLSLARANNTKLGITGMLLYDGNGTFLQAIEGDKTKIDDLFQVISRDQRHSMVQQLSYTEIKTRNFPDWQMGFKRIGEMDAKPQEGHSRFLDENTDANTPTHSDSFAHDMLNHFKQSCM